MICESELICKNNPRVPLESKTYRNLAQIGTIRCHNVLQGQSKSSILVQNESRGSFGKYWLQNIYLCYPHTNGTRKCCLQNTYVTLVPTLIQSMSPSKSWKKIKKGLTN